jgi:hypothetical protein
MKIHCRDFKCPHNNNNKYYPNKNEWPLGYCSLVEGINFLINPLEMVKSCQIPYIISD